MINRKSDIETIQKSLSDMDIKSYNLLMNNETTCLDTNIPLKMTSLCDINTIEIIDNESNSEEILAPEICITTTKSIEGLQSFELKDRMLWSKGFKYCKSGGLIFIDKDIQKRQQGVVKDVLINLGSQFLSGKVDVSLSLPVRVFEPRTMLQRLADTFIYAPTLLSKAALIRNNPIERIKYIASFIIGGLHFCVGQLKPFNPVLGETFQGTFPDGTEIFMEHVSHHPPICYYSMYGPNNSYLLSGICEFTASIKGNAFISSQVGNVSIDFPDQTRIVYTVPYIKISGLLVGDRQVEWLGESKIIDEKNDLECILTINQPSSLFGKAIKSDVIKGSIRSRQQKDITLLSTIEGSWLNHLSFNGIKYWDLQTEPIYPLVTSSNALPSDSSFRSDLTSLASGNAKTAQVNKLEIEALQRNDRKLRLAIKEKLKKETKK